MDPDQAQHFVGLDLGPNCLQSSSADDTGRQSDRLEGLGFYLNINPQKSGNMINRKFIWN